MINGRIRIKKSAKYKGKIGNNEKDEENLHHTTNLHNGKLMPQP